MKVQSRNATYSVSMLEPSSGQACSQEFGVQFSFRFKFPAIMQSGSGHSIFFQNQTRCSEVAANRIVLGQADVSDNHAVRNSKPILFSSHNF